MSKNLIISLSILTLIFIMSVSILGKRNKNIISVNTIVSSGNVIITNNTREDIVKVQKESSFDCTSFTSASDKTHCGEDAKIINDALVS